MATTKVVTVLSNDVTITKDQGAEAVASADWDLDNGFGGQLYIEVTNGATGPTVAAILQIYASPDDTTYYKFGGALGSTLGNNAVTTWSIPIPIGVEFIRVMSGSNTDQDVVVRVEGSEVTAIA